MMECMTCRKGPPFRLRWQTFDDRTRHIRAECRKCGAFVGWAVQSEDNVAGCLAEVADEPRSESNQKELFPED